MSNKINIDFIDNIEKKNFADNEPIIAEALIEKFNNNPFIISFMEKIQSLEKLSQNLEEINLDCLKESDDKDDDSDDKDKKKNCDDDSDDDDSDDDDSDDDDSDDDDSDDDSDDDDDDSDDDGDDD